jgi:signal transduction histidine kinase
MFTINSWMLEDPALAFNGSWYDWGWQIFSLSLAFLGLLVLIIGRPASWGTGIAVLGLILAGYVANLLIQPQGYFSGIVRLSQLCAFPLLPVLAHRLVRPGAPIPTPAVEERRGYEPHLVLSWLQAAAETDPRALSAALARAVGQSMLADLCFLIAAPDARGRWTLLGGRDLVSEEDLPDGALDAEKIPNLSAALQRGRSIRLPQPGQPEPIDLKALGEAFSLEDAGSLLAAPLINDGKVTGGIVLLSPYSNRAWSAEEQSQLMSVAEAVVPILQRGAPRSEPAPDNAQIEALQRENTRLSSEVASLRKPALLPLGESDMDALMAVQKESQDTILQLQAELEKLRGAVKSSTTSGQVETELRMALEDNAYLRNDLAAAEGRIEVLKRAARGTPNSDQSALIGAISQELRQPMSLLASYTEMLLAEAAGTLDVTQLGYLDRIKTSVDRMRTMLDDLTRAASLQSGAPLFPQAVNLSAVLDSAVSSATSMLREKDINFRVDIPTPLPTFHANEDALRQIVVDLLRNAFSVTPEGSTVILRVRVEENGGGPSLQLQVKDSGGGIAEAARERIFEPKSPGGNPSPVAGVADGGFGLAITQALVKALGGKIWVESDPGKTATFYVHLPSARSSQPGNSPEAA